MGSALQYEYPKGFQLQEKIASLLNHPTDLPLNSEWNTGEWSAFIEKFRKPFHKDTSRTRAELFILNRVCALYRELLLTEGQKVQYVVVGTHQGASAIAACLNNPDILAITIDSYDDLAYRDYKNNEGKAREYIGQFGDQKIEMISASSADPNLPTQIKTLKGFDKKQGINVFFYDGFDGREGDPNDILGKTFENILPLCSDFSVWIINKYEKITHKDHGKAYIKDAFEEKVEYNGKEIQTVDQYKLESELEVKFTVKYVLKENKLLWS
jgi:hypothetical protein